MNATLVAQVIVWIIVGGLAGSLVGMIFRRGRAGFEQLLNLLLGMVGAILGGSAIAVSIPANLGAVPLSVIAFFLFVASTAISALWILRDLWLQWRQNRT